jgi:putative membrane protein
MWLALAAIAVLVASGIGPHDRGTWILEVFPVVIALPLLAWLRPSLPFTPLVYRFIFIHALILMLGGHYTYAQVPFGHWLQELLDLSRNPYDRIGHFAQGFVPALIAREVILRTTPLRQGKMLFFIVCCISLAISAFYELIEWWSAVALGAGADAFLGTQGDTWDTQWDMFTALLGALTAQITLSRSQDRALQQG